MPGFFDEYQDIGGNFVSAEEKQYLIDNGVPFPITAVVEDHAFGQDRFVAKVELPEDVSEDADWTELVERNIAFPKSGVESRDRMLDQMKEYLLRPDSEPVTVKLEKVKRSIIIRNAES